MADKLYNLRDLERQLPVGWTEERRQTYYLWARQVTDAWRGDKVNLLLANALDEFFKRNGL